MKNFPWPIRFSRQEAIIYLSIAVLSIIGSVLLLTNLESYPYNLGKPLIALFIPPSISVAYLVYFGYSSGINRELLLKTMLLYIIQIIPLYPIFNKTYIPIAGDDFARYYYYAKNMIAHKTLWGGDQLFYKDYGLYYVTQPGYRYLLFAELLIFGNLYRGVSLIYTASYITSVYLLLRVIETIIEDKKAKTCLFILMVLITPYAIKNLLMGLSEWFTVILGICFCYLLLLRKKILFPVFLLALIPFFRQNLLLAVIFIFFVIVYKNRKWRWASVIFILTILLPVYHNLYYAGEFRFFVDLSVATKVTISTSDFTIRGLRPYLIFSNVIHYFGFDYETRKIIFSFIAFLFLPFAIYTYFVMAKVLAKHNVLPLYLMITATFVLPVLILGSAYYPRFEFINTFFSIIVFTILVARVRKWKLNSLEKKI